MEVGKYLEELTDPAIPLRSVGLMDLSHLDSRELEELAANWQRIGTSRRRELLRKLIELSEDNVDFNFDTVFMMGLDDTDSEVRAEAIRGLWECEDPELSQLLTKFLVEDSASNVRTEAAIALGRFVLMSEYGRLRDRHFGPLELGLRQVLSDPGEEEEVKARALESIGACRSRGWVQETIRDFYRGRSPRLRRAAIHAMGRSCDCRWMPILIHELRSHDLSMRYEAALACGALGDANVVPHLKPLFQTDDFEVQTAAINALGEIGGPQARSLLAAIQDDPSQAIREAVREAIREIDFSDSPLNVPEE